MHPSAWELQQWNLYRRDAQQPDYLQRFQCNSHPRSRHVEADAPVTHTYSATEQDYSRFFLLNCSGICEEKMLKLVQWLMLRNNNLYLSFPYKQLKVGLFRIPQAY